MSGMPRLYLVSHCKAGEPYRFLGPTQNLRQAQR